jgi:hypothetical protein
MIDRFLPLYLEAAEKGVTKEEFAAQVGLKPDTVYQRVYALRRKGMDIPLLRSKGKIPLLEQADKILTEYRAKRGAPAPAQSKAPKDKENPTKAAAPKADADPALVGESVEDIASLLGMN